MYKEIQEGSIKAVDGAGVQSGGPAGMQPKLLKWV